MSGTEDAIYSRDTKMVEQLDITPKNGNNILSIKIQLIYEQI